MSDPESPKPPPGEPPRFAPPEPAAPDAPREERHAWDTGSSPSTVLRSLWAGRRDRVRTVTVAGMLILAIAIAFLRAPDRAEDGPGAREDLMKGSLSQPRTMSDPVPKGPVINRYPARCGVSAATAAKLSPGSDHSGKERGAFANRSKGNCTWYSLNDGKEKRGWVPDSNDLRKERVLRVGITLHTPYTLGSAVGRAIAEVDPAPSASVQSDDPPRLVTGLGEEAVAIYSPAIDEGASVRFRTGNAAVAVGYKGWDRKGKDPAQRQIPREAALAGALKAAAETAKALGAPASPRFGDPPTAGRPVRWVPRPCDTVSKATLRKVAHGADRERGNEQLLIRAYGVRSDTCRWAVHKPSSSTMDSERNLQVAVAAVADWRPGIGSFVASREYLRLHHDARDSQPHATLNTQRDFTALRGLGDQAFVAYGKHPSGGIETAGRVVFRVRNVLVQVSYHSGSSDDQPLTQDQAVDGAYTAAADVARSLRS